jgi:hypothetical protein
MGMKQNKILKYNFHNGHVQAAHSGPAVHLHTSHPHGLMAPSPCKLCNFFVDCRQGGGGYQKSRKLENVLNGYSLSCQQMSGDLQQSFIEIKVNKIMQDRNK